MSPQEELLAKPITLILALGIASLLPFAFMTLTAFVKISTVLQIVRGAIGAQNVPTNTVIMAFAGALTLLAQVLTEVLDSPADLQLGHVSMVLTLASTHNPCAQ